MTHRHRGHEIAEGEVKTVLYLAIGQLIHQERQREIERSLETRRLLEPVDDGGWNLRHGPSKSGAEPRRGTRQEAAGAAS